MPTGMGKFPSRGKLNRKHACGTCTCICMGSVAIIIEYMYMWFVGFACGTCTY